METNYKRTVAGSVGAGFGAIFNATGRTFYILEHKTESKYHHAGESQKIIVDQIELGRDSSCQVRFDESFETVSRKHAAIVRDGNNWKIVPLSSTNATFVNSQPITGERILNSGDEIKLSSNGPVLGFIVPQGSQSMVKSIGLTERMNLFRKQALRPYKTALWILFVVLVLAVGALVAWNLWQSRNYEEQLYEMQMAQKDISDEIADKDAEIAELTEKLQNSDLRAKMTASEVRRANASLKQYEEERETLAKKQQEINASLEELSTKVETKAVAAVSEADVPEKGNDVVDEVRKDKDVEARKYTDITECYSSVYYIKMDDISVFDKDNKELVRFVTSYIGGTGFLLENGRFVTAKRVVEPWFYYRPDTVIGKDKAGVEWKFGDLQVLALEDFKVVANFTAYASNGMNFKFKNTDMRGDANFTMTEKRDYYTTVEEYRINRSIYRFFKKHTFEIKYFNKSTMVDWASMAKSEQLGRNNGLIADYEASLHPTGHTEVSILGFPKGIGMNNSESVTPDLRINNINVTGLNDVNLIELSSSRYQEGNDGSPVFINKDGQWVVIGILSHTDGADRDVVVPISYTR